MVDGPLYQEEQVERTINQVAQAVGTREESRIRDKIPLNGRPVEGSGPSSTSLTSDTPQNHLIPERSHNEVAVRANPDVGLDARIAAFAGLRPVLGEDRLTVGPAWFHRMAVAELGRFSAASGHALAELMWPL